MAFPRYVWLTRGELEVAWLIVHATRIQEEFCTEDLGLIPPLSRFLPKTQWP
jgi:hypothetical protein